MDNAGFILNTPEEAGIIRDRPGKYYYSLPFSHLNSNSTDSFHLCSYCDVWRDTDGKGRPQTECVYDHGNCAHLIHTRDRKYRFAPCRDRGGRALIWKRLRGC